MPYASTLVGSTLYDFNGSDDLHRKCGHQQKKAGDTIAIVVLKDNSLTCYSGGYCGSRTRQTNKVTCKDQEWEKQKASVGIA
jgi:hypothetical protein